MLARFLSAAALLALLFPAPARPADPPAADGPTLIIRLQSLDALLEHGQYIADLAGQQERAKQAAGMVQAFTDKEKGIEGIDTKRPFGLYATLAPDLPNSPVVLLVPIASEEAFMGLLKNRLNQNPKKDDDGVYTLQPPGLPVPVYFRFANKYLYVTAMNKESIAAKAILAPEKVLPGKPDAVASLSLFIDRIPKSMRETALGQFEMRIAEAKKQKLPNETPAIAALRDASIDSLVGCVKELLYDGREVSMRLVINRETDELAIEASLSAREGSRLAKQFAGFAEFRSLSYGAVRAKSPAASGGLDAALPSGVRKALGPAVDDFIKMAVQQAPADRREAARTLLEALAPTLKAGEFDGAASLRGPAEGGRYTVLGAGKVREGKGIEKAARALLKMAPEPVRKQIELDAGESGGVKLHRITIPDLDANAKRLFGDSPVWVASADDRVVVGFGADAKAAIGEALAAQPQTGPIGFLEGFAARLVPLIDQKRDREAGEAAVKKVFGEQPKGDAMRMTLEGGSALRFRASINGKVIRMAVLAEEGSKRPKPKEE